MHILDLIEQFPAHDRLVDTYALNPFPDKIPCINWISQNFMNQALADTLASLIRKASSEINSEMEDKEYLPEACHLLIFSITANCLF
jgi:hypothetical protein